MQYQNPPIVEAIVDIHCDMPTDFSLEAYQTSARETFKSDYPVAKILRKREYQIEQNADEPPSHQINDGIDAYRYLKADKLQLVQVRQQGYSFNRLQPYSSLDDYLPEIKRTWEAYVKLVKPVVIRSIHLRYINLLPLPSVNGKLNTDDYFKTGPHLPDEETLQLGGFLIHNVAIEPGTKNQVNIRLASQDSVDNKLPVILDIEAVSNKDIQPENWSEIESQIQQLRELKNRVFDKTLTDKCKEMFK